MTQYLRGGRPDRASPRTVDPAARAVRRRRRHHDGVSANLPSARAPRAPRAPGALPSPSSSPPAATCAAAAPPGAARLPAPRRAAAPPRRRAALPRRRAALPRRRSGGRVRLAPWVRLAPPGRRVLPAGCLGEVRLELVDRLLVGQHLCSWAIVLLFDAALLP